MPPVLKTYANGVRKRRKGLPKFILQRDGFDDIDVFDALHIEHIKTLKAQTKHAPKKNARPDKTKKKSPVPILGESTDDIFDRLLSEGPVARELPKPDDGHSESIVNEISSSSSECRTPVLESWICEGNKIIPGKFSVPKLKTFFKKVTRKKILKVSSKQEELSIFIDSDGVQAKKSIEPSSQSFVQEVAEGSPLPCRTSIEKIGPPESSSTPFRQHSRKFFASVVTPIRSYNVRRSVQLCQSPDMFDSEGTFNQLTSVGMSFCGVCGRPQCEECSCKKPSDSAALRCKERGLTLPSPVKSNSSLDLEVKSLIGLMRSVHTSVRDEHLQSDQLSIEGDYQDVPANLNIKELSFQRSRMNMKPSCVENCSHSESRSESFCNESLQMSKEPCNQVKGNDSVKSKAEESLLQPSDQRIHLIAKTSTCQNSKKDIFEDSCINTSIITANLNEIAQRRNGNEQTLAPSVETPGRETDIKLVSNNSSITEGSSRPSLRVSLRPSQGELQPVVLKSGKHYRRSLSMLRARQSTPFESSPVNLNHRRTSIQPVKGRLWQSTFNHIKEIQLSRDIPLEVSCDEQSNVPLPLEVVSECSYRSSTTSTDLLGDAKLEVLRRCSQEEPLPFMDCYPASMKAKCVKIGEGVYGEVFMYKGSKDRQPAVIKVIPIEGDLEVNGEPQKKFHEILSEICIAQELTNLRNKGDNSTAMFNEVIGVRCVQGSYPFWLTELWYEYDSNKGSENDAPDVFEEHQLYIVLELSNGGKDLESFVFSSADQGLAAFKQVTLTLAVGESALQFEHRDLHWGNVLLTPCKEKNVQFMLDGDYFQFPSKGVKISIIDFTLSRMSNPSTCLPIFCDLSKDETLFTAQGDYQFEVYRLMKECTMNTWSNFAPKTNVVWLHYLLDKLCTMARYKNRGSKIHQHALDTLQEMRDTILSYPSAAEFAKTLYFKN